MDKILGSSPRSVREGCLILDLVLVLADMCEDEDPDGDAVFQSDEVAAMFAVHPGLERCLPQPQKVRANRGA